MTSKKVEVLVSADKQEDFTTIQKALAAYAKAFTAKEHDKLRMIILYDPATLGMLKQRLNT